MTSQDSPALPRLLRAGDLAAGDRIYGNLHRFNRFVEQEPDARWQKMALKVFKLHGDEGGLRSRNLMLNRSASQAASRVGSGRA